MDHDEVMAMLASESMGWIHAPDQRLIQDLTSVLLSTTLWMQDGEVVAVNPFGDDFDYSVWQETQATAPEEQRML